MTIKTKLNQAHKTATPKPPAPQEAPKPPKKKDSKERRGN